MRRVALLLVLITLYSPSYAQRMNVLEEIKTNPQKAYGTDYPYTFDAPALTKSPKGYEPFYISHYARHGSRYYWSNSLYLELDTILTEAHEKHLLNAEGEKFYEQYKALYPEFMAGMGELTRVGWDQHQAIARKMYESFPEVFKKGGTVRAISSTTGRCIISMSAFCQALVQCNPKIDIYEQASRSTLHGVKPDADENPYRQKVERARLEMDMSGFSPATQQVASNDEIVARLFNSTEGLSRSSRRIYSNLKNLYTSLPSISHEELLVGLFKPEELTAGWERSNLNSYRNWYRDINVMKPIVADILEQAKLVIDGKCNDIASLRFGHDTNLGPLNILMGINMPKEGVTDPNQLKYYFQDFQIGKASNLQFIFYKSKKNPEILVKCLQNGYEVMLPLDTDNYPYYKWTDFYNYYSNICKQDGAAMEQVSDVNSRDLRGKVVYEDDEVVFRQIDEHTWIGNGHRVYNESLYLVEGNDRAVLLDAGTNIPRLDKIVAGITSKPVTLMLTHGHGDHVGGAGPFPEVWVAPADEQMFKGNVRRYKGEIKYLADGQIIDLGGRKLEVMFTPGHTSGSVTFFDKENHYGFSGDAFGSTNLLVFTYLSNVVSSATKVEKYIKDNDIRFLFPGHYSGDNLESPKRVSDLKEMCQEVLDGKRQGIKSDGNSGGNDMMIEDRGVRVTFSSKNGIK